MSNSQKKTELYKLLDLELKWKGRMVTEKAQLENFQFHELLLKFASKIRLNG